MVYIYIYISGLPGEQIYAYTHTHAYTCTRTAARDTIRFIIESIAFIVFKARGGQHTARRAATSYIYIYKHFPFPPRPTKCADMLLKCFCFKHDCPYLISPFSHSHSFPWEVHMWVDVHACSQHLAWLHCRVQGRGTAPPDALVCHFSDHSSRVQLI